MTATVTPEGANQDVAWSISPTSGIATVTANSTNSKVATVTPTGAGTATITATANGKSTTCTVNVTDSTGGNTDEVTKIEIREYFRLPEGGDHWGNVTPQTEIITNGDGKRVKAVLTPSTSDAEVTWEIPSGSSIQIEKAAERNEFLISSTGNIEDTYVKVKAGTYEESFKVKVLPKITVGEPDASESGKLKFVPTIEGCPTEPVVEKINVKQDTTDVTNNGWLPSYENNTLTLTVPSGASGTYTLEFNGGIKGYWSKATKEFTVTATSTPEVPSGKLVTEIDFGNRTEHTMSVTLRNGMTIGSIGVYPWDATDQTLEWHSDPAGIVTLTGMEDRMGPKVQILPIKAGTVKVWATAKVGGVRSDQDFTIKVTPAVTVTAPAEDIPAIEKTKATAFEYTVTGFENVTADEVTATIKHGVDGTINESQWTIDKSTPGRVTVTPSADVNKAETYYKIIISVTRDGCTGKVEKKFTVKEPTVQVIPVTGITLQGAQDVNCTITKRGGQIESAHQDYTAVITPENATNQKVIWSSTDDRIATRSTTITGGSDPDDKMVWFDLGAGGIEGTATITARTADGGHTATTNVTIRKLGITSVSLPDITMKVGETKKIEANITPKDAWDISANWTSSDASVATVNEGGYVDTSTNCVGTIRAKKEGTTTITVQMTGELSGSKTATCTVTVEPAEAEGGVQSVAIEGDAEHEIAPARQAVQAQPIPPRTFSFIPQREI